jgi:tyrosine-protein phosphatase YwqE
MSDGLKSVEDSVSILKELKAQNILNVFLTPTYLNAGETVRAFINRRNNAYKLMSPEIPRGMHIYLSAKVLFMEDTLDNLFISRLTYKKSLYLFVELPSLVDLSWLEYELYYLLHKAKLIPIFVNFDHYRQLYDEKTYSRLMKIPYAVYQFNANSLNNLQNIENINKLCTNGKTVVFGSNLPNNSADVGDIKKNIEGLKTVLPINIYRDLMMNGIKLHNKIIK